MADVFTWMAGQVPVATPKKERQPAAGRTFTLPVSTYKAIAEMLEQNVAQGAIARQLGIKFYHVNNLKRRLAAGKGMPAEATRPTDEHADQLADLVASGLTVRAAARRLGVKESAAYGVFRYKLRTPVKELRK